MDKQSGIDGSGNPFSIRKEMFTFLPAMGMPPALIPVHDRSSQLALTTRAVLLPEFAAEVHRISLQMSQSAS
jgi:hypothetical protein